MEETLLGITNVVRLVHPLNAVEPILVKPSERFTDFNAAQSLNADVFIDVTLCGIVISSTALQP